MATDSTQSRVPVRFPVARLVAVLALVACGWALASCTQEQRSAVEVEPLPTAEPDQTPPGSSDRSQAASEVPQSRAELDVERSSSEKTRDEQRPDEDAGTPTSADEETRGDDRTRDSAIGDDDSEGSETASTEIEQPEDVVFEPGDGVVVAQAPSATGDPDLDAAPVDVDELLAYTSLRDVDCPADLDASIRCQRVSLPEDRHVPDNDRVVELMVATVDNGDPSDIGPVVFLQGGPGAGAVRQANDYVGSGFDVVLVDQRGTGLSVPLLDCPEMVEVYDAIISKESENERAKRLQRQSEQRCHDRLVDEGVNFAAYTSAASATDIALLRRVLGYDEWNLFGSSYGTRLALTVARDHPEGVRTMILDSVLPPDVDFFGEIGLNYLRSLDRLNEACAVNESCSESYGDLREAVDAAAAQLDYEPAELQMVRPTSNETITVTVDGVRFHSYVFEALYLRSRLPELPGLIHRAATTGDVGELAAEAAADADPEAADFAEAMYWAVMCAEEYPFIEPSADDELAQVGDPAVVAAFSTQQFADACEQFGVPSASEVENRPINPPMPVLAATGAFDPITPPAWGQRLSEQSNTVTFVEVQGRAHGVASSCFSQVLEAFLVTPGGPLDVTCTRDGQIAFN